MKTASDDLQFIVTRDGVVETIIDSFGLEFMRKVSAALGGLEIKLPHAANLHDGHAVVVALGMEDAVRLCGLFPSEKISFPKGRHARNLPRHGAYLIDAMNDGRSIADIAFALNISMRHVRRVLGNMGLKGRFQPPSRRPHTEAIWRDREIVIRAYVLKEIDRQTAAEKLRVAEATIKRWGTLFRDKGTIIPRYIPSPAAAINPDSSSNGALPALAHLPSGVTAPANENRASGL